MTDQRVSAAVGAVACSAAISACRRYSVASRVWWPAGLGRGARRSGSREGDALGDLVAVPAGAVLVGQQDQGAGGVEAGVAAGVLQEQEGEQGADDGPVGQQGVEHAQEADGLVAEVDAQGDVADAGVVAGGEGEVDDGRDDVEPLVEPRGGGGREGDAGGRQPLLGAGQPGGHGRLLDEQEAADLGGGEADDEAQGQGDAVVGGDRGVAAGEDQPELLVGHVGAGVDDGRGGGAHLVVDDHQGFLLPLAPPRSGGGRGRAGARP